jgi:Lrp/AsnC family transcriptional regulator, leucine-responsive regulatory protein
MDFIALCCGYHGPEGNCPPPDRRPRELDAPRRAAQGHRRLEERGVIRGYAALLDPAAVGARLTAFVAVTLEHPKYRRAFLQRVDSLAEVQECHHVAGDDDYLLKVRCSDTAHLDRVLSEELKDVPGVLRTRTTIVLGTAKETTMLPLPATDDDAGGD